MRARLVLREAPNRNADALADRLGDCAHRHAFFGSAMQERSGRCFLEGESKEPRGIQPMYGRPSVRAVADERGDARAAGDTDQDWYEAMVAGSVDGRRESHDAGAHPATGGGPHGQLRRCAWNGSAI